MQKNRLGNFPTRFIIEPFNLNPKSGNKTYFTNFLAKRDLSRFALFLWIKPLE